MQFAANLVSAPRQSKHAPFLKFLRVGCFYRNSIHRSTYAWYIAADFIAQHCRPRYLGDSDKRIRRRWRICKSSKKGRCSRWRLNRPRVKQGWVAGYRIRKLTNSQPPLLGVMSELCHSRRLLLIGPTDSSSAGVEVSLQIEFFSSLLAPITPMRLREGISVAKAAVAPTRCLALFERIEAAVSPAI